MLRLFGSLLEEFGLLDRVVNPLHTANENIKALKHEELISKID